jgi:prepilin-type N-terminal cleavage/methylation domain-containing protein
MPKTKYPIFKCMHRGEKGFTLIELLVVIAILGIIAAVVVLNIAGFFGRGKAEAANTEAHQVQTAMVAYMASSANATKDGAVGPADNIPDGANTSVECVWKYLLNPGLLQAVYNITSGVIVDASPITGSKWGGCGWNDTKGMWECP